MCSITAKPQTPIRGHRNIVNGNIVFKFVKHVYPSIKVLQLGARN